MVALSSELTLIAFFIFLLAHSLLLTSQSKRLSVLFPSAEKTASMISIDNKNPVNVCSNDRNEKLKLTSTNLVDPASMAILNHAGDLNNCKCPDNTHDDDNYVRKFSRSTSSRNSRSQDTAIIATEVGSVVSPKKNPFMMSFTFFDPTVYYKRLPGEKSPVAKTEANICLDPINEDVDMLVCEDVTFYNPNTYYKMLEKENNGTKFDDGTSTDTDAREAHEAYKSNDDKKPVECTPKTTMIQT